MGLFDRIKDRLFYRHDTWSDLEPGERRLLELVTAGDAPALQRLRAQWGEPFWLGADRKAHRDKDVYDITLVYDGNTVDRHSIGENVNLRIDDLQIVDRRITAPLSCVGFVSDGILTTIRCTTPQPVRWPKHLVVDDWFYRGDSGQQSKTRTQDWAAKVDAAAAAPRRLDPKVEAAIPRDYVEYMDRPDRTWEVHDARLLRISELYFLDDARVKGRFLVFASLADASVLAFKIVKGAADGVYFVSVTDGAAERVAGTFTRWLSEGESS